MTTNIVETLPWVDYREVFTKLEERGKAEGKAEGMAEGKAKTQMEVAVKAFTGLGRGKEPGVVAQMLKDLGIPERVIEAAKLEAGRAVQDRNRRGQER